MVDAQRVAGVKSPPTRRVVDVLTALSAVPHGLSSAELSRRCELTTSTASLLLAELERNHWVVRRDDRRYTLGSGLFSVVRGLREQFPLLDRGREALVRLHTALGAACSMSKISRHHLVIVDTVGHAVDGEHPVGHQFPIDPPFGLVAMAWRDNDAIERWLHDMTPRLSQTDIAEHQRVLADIRARGYGAWRFDDAQGALHDRLAAVLASLGSTSRVTRQLTTLMTMVTLRSVTDSLECDLGKAEFVVVPIFGPDRQPDYQIEIHLGRSPSVGLAELNSAVAEAQQILSPGGV